MHAIILAFLVLVAQVACQKKNEDALQVGMSPLDRFDFRAFTELTFTRQNPEKGISWSAKLNRNQGLWMIEQLSAVPILGDKFASTGLIDHLLDAATTFKTLEILPRSNPKAYGLDTPEFSIEWPGYALKFGKPAQENGRYFEWQGQTGIARGSVLEFMNHLLEPTQIRLNRLLLKPLDEVSAITAKTKETFSLERVSGEWKSKTHPKLSATSIEAWLNALFHLQIHTFIDSPEQTKNKGPTLIATLEISGIKDQRTVLEIYRNGDSLLAKASDRPNGQFVLPLTATRYFLPPSR